MSKIVTSTKNGVLQLLPMLSTLLLSLFFVRLFSISIWGNIVSILIIQQIANSLISWGNKDYLQRELANNSLLFKSLFTTLFLERFLLFFVIIVFVFFFKLIDFSCYLAFTYLVFGRFVHQSFDVLILKERKFKLAIVLEVVQIIIQIFTLFELYKHNNRETSDLLIVFWLPMLLKGIVLLLFFKSYITFKKLNQKVLFKSFPFAMLNLSGLIHTKVDVLLISKILDSQILGKYQIITAFLWNIQSIALYISGPFIHNFYRLNKISKNNYSKFLNQIGILIVPIGVLLMAIILHYFFKIQINYSIFIASLLFCSMSFIYLPMIFRINNNKKEFLVLIVNIIGTLVLICFLLLCNTIWKLSLEGIIWIITIHQLFITISLYFANKFFNK